MRRREFLRAGLTGLASLTLPELIASRARAGYGSPEERTALLVVWLQGGASHLETYDPKPDAPSRGPRAVRLDRHEGRRRSDLANCLPCTREVADKFTILRSLAHSGFCHQQGNQQMFTGHPEQVLKLQPEHPDLMCVANRMRSASGSSGADVRGRQPDPLPRLGLPRARRTSRSPSTATRTCRQFRVPELGPGKASEVDRLRPADEPRGAVRPASPRARRSDARPRHFDAFQQQAFALLTGPEARRAFELDREDPRLRDRYGRNTWGQRCLLARRLVEAGVDLVTTSLDGPLCGRVGNWDDHAVNHHVFDAMKARCRYFDQAVSALIEDIHARGLDRRVLVVVTGEFGRTPKISYAKDSASGVTAAGPRPLATRRLAALQRRGASPGGQVVGATDRLGADVTRLASGCATSSRRSTVTSASTPQPSPSATRRAARSPPYPRDVRSPSWSLLHSASGPDRSGRTNAATRLVEKDNGPIFTDFGDFDCGLALARVAGRDRIRLDPLRSAAKSPRGIRCFMKGIVQDMIASTPRGGRPCGR